ncbi:MAG: hypothetical protein RL199_1480 [Pseudomonadota bacterium]
MRPVPFFAASLALLVAACHRPVVTVVVPAPADAVVDTDTTTLEPDPAAPSAPQAPEKAPVLPVEPDALAPGPSLEPRVDPLSDRPAAAAFALDGGVLAQEGVELRWHPVSGDPQVVGVEAVDGKLLSAVTLHVGEKSTTLVATSLGLRLLRNGGLEETPLQQSLGRRVARTLVGVPGLAGAQQGLWLVCDDALYLWRDGSLQEVRLTGVTLKGAVVAAGAAYGADDALWLASGTSVFAVVLTSTALRVWRVRDDLGVDSMAGSEGALWIASGGDLWRRSADGLWDWYALEGGAKARAVFGTRGSDALWLAHDAGLWVRVEGSFRAVSAPPPFSAAWPGASGQLLVSGSAGLARLRARRDLSLDPVSLDGAVFDLNPQAAALTISALPEVPDEVASVAWTLDDAPLQGSDAWTVDVRAAALSEGVHVLEAVARYRFEPLAARASARFSVKSNYVPRWTDDIEPIVGRSCGACHGQGKPTQNPLWRSSDWQAVVAGERQAERALGEMRTGRMPLGGPVMKPAEIAVVQKWVDAGFPE